MKRILFLSQVMLLLSGCLFVDTNPRHAFEQVQQDVCVRTGQTIQKGLCTEVREILEQKLTVDLAVYIALIHNPELQALYDNLGIAKAGVAQAGLPQNPIFAYAYRFSQDPLVTNLIDYGLFQNIIETLLIPLKRKAAANELEATRHFVTAQVLEVIAETKKAFFSFQAAEHIWMLQNNVLLAADAAYDAATRLYQAGNITELALTEKRLEYERAKVDLAAAEMQMYQEREGLNVLMGLWGTQIQWESAHCFPAIVEDEMQWNGSENRAIANSLDLRSMRKQLYVTAARMGVDTARFVFPQLDFGVSAQREDSVWYVGPAFSSAIPFFDLGIAGNAAARSAISQQWHAYTAQAIKIRSAARLARLEVLNAFRNVRYFDQVVVPLAEKYTNDTLLQHNAMQLGVFALLMAKQQELMNKIDAVMMEKEYWLARTNLEMILTGHVKEI